MNGEIFGPLYYSGVETMHYIFFCIGIIFIFAFLFLRSRACYQQYGTKSIGADYKYNTRCYISALFAISVIFQLSFFIELCKIYFDTKVPELFSEVLAKGMGLASSAILAYAVLSIGRRRRIAGFGFALKGISLILPMIFNLVKFSYFHLDWLTTVDLIVYIAVAIMLFRGTAPKAFKLVLLAYLALSIIMVFVACGNMEYRRTIDMIFYYIVPTALPVIAFNTATFLLV